MLKVAQYLCKLITTYTPVITQLYPNNEDLLAALAAANTACAALSASLAPVRETGD
jgi:hypothetical protein